MDLIAWIQKSVASWTNLEREATRVHMSWDEMGILLIASVLNDSGCHQVYETISGIIVPLRSISIPDHLSGRSP